MIVLTAPALRQIWPRAPQTVIEAFVSPEGQKALADAGISATRTRLSVALSQVEHETAGFTIKDLTENIMYSPSRAAQIWPSRFPGGGAQVAAKYGTAPGWQLKLMDDVYGGRMGNRPNTRDGSLYIGRGGPQVTGADGYENVGKRMDPPKDLKANPLLASSHALQPQVLAAFWTWKKLNPIVDVGGLKAATKPWNGGYIGMADREAAMAGNDPIVARLEKANATLPQVKDLPGDPPAPKPTKDALDAATAKERRARAGGGAGAAAGGGNEVAKTATTQSTEQPSAPAQTTKLLPSHVALGMMALGIVVVVVASVLIWRKKQAVISNWF